MRKRRTLTEKAEGGSFELGKGRLPYWVRIPFADGWVLWQRLAPQAGGLVVAEARIFPDTTPPLVKGVREKQLAKAGEWSRAAEAVPAGGLTTTVVRRASVGPHVAAPIVTDWIAGATRGGPLGGLLALSPTARALARRVAKELGLAGRVARELGLVPPPPPTKSRRGRPGRRADRDRAFFEQLAADYRRWWMDNPAKRLVEKHGVSRGTVSAWIHTARHELGLLPPTSRGRGSMFAKRKGASK